MIKYSIIMPTYNRSDLIIESIKSVINQTYKNWELIIVDDNSLYDHRKQNEINIFKFNDKRISYYYLKKNNGHSYARNFGLAKAKNEWIKYLDDDNIMYNTCLESFNAFINDDVKIITSKYELINSDTGYKKIKGNDFLLYNIFDSCQLDTCSFVHHIDCFKQLGGWDVNLYRMADDDIIFRYVTKFIDHYRFCDKVTASFNVRTSIKRVTTDVGNITYVKIIRNKFDFYKKIGKCLIVTNSNVRLNNLINNDYESDCFIDSDILINFKNELYDFDFILEDNIGDIKKIVTKYNQYNFLFLYNDNDKITLNEIFYRYKITKCNFIKNKNSIFFNIHDLNNFKFILKNNFVWT